MSPRTSAQAAADAVWFGVRSTDQARRVTDQVDRVIAMAQRATSIPVRRPADPVLSIRFALDVHLPARTEVPEAA